MLIGSLLQVQAITPDAVTLNESIKEVPTAPINPHRAFVSRRTLSSAEMGATLQFEVALKMRSLPDLQSRLENGERISFTEMNARYNPTDTDYNKVVAWLTSHGFAITRQDKNHLAVFVHAKVSNVQSTLGVSFARVSVEGTEYTSAVTPPVLPADLAPLVVGINGLQPHLRMHKQVIARPNSLTDTNPPYLPRQIAQAYNASGLYTSNITGAGQTIAIVIDTFPAASDLTSFWSTYGVNQSMSNITFIQAVAGTLDAPSGEETLDTEWSSSLAPGAKVRVYASQSLDFSSLDQTYQQVYADVTAHPEYNIHQMSMSYGIGETYTSNSQVQTDDQYFAELASAGVTVFASSGDAGSTPGSFGSNDERGSIQAESPASDPNVTGVGGTSLTLDSNGNASGETVWNDQEGASGGGISQYFTRPYWQTGAGVPTGTARLVPDVASAADPSTGAVVFLGGSQTILGGTSWSSPTWAAFCALINQERGNAGNASMGLFGPYLYPQLGTTGFRDITSGSNATANSAGSYLAGAGYDLTSGVGVPNLATLAQTLRSFVPGTPVAPVFTSATPPTTVTINTNYSFNFTASGYPSPTFALTSGNLPSGITLAPDGFLSGTPTAGGAYTATVTASNGVNPAASKTFTITVQNLPTAPVFTSGAPTSSALTTFPYSFTFTASGFPAPVIALATGNLPPGLTLTSGVLSGTPTQTGTFSGTIRASNGVNPAASQSFSIVVQSPVAPAITNGPPPSTAPLNTAYHFAYAGTGLPTPTFSVLTGSLPPGLSLSSDGVISGTPIQDGFFTGTISAANGFGTAATQNFNITIQQASGITNAPLNVPIALEVPYSFTFAAVGFPTPTFSVTTGNLPPGLKLSSSGVLSGAPTQTGVYTGTITASNAAGSSGQSFTITVVASLALTINLPATLNEGDPDGQGTVVLNAVSSNPTTVQLTSSNTGAFTLPASVVIPAGQTSVPLPYTIIDNLTIFGPETTTLTAHASGWIDATQVLTITDNKTTDNWSSFGNGQAHTGVYRGPLLAGTYNQSWISAIPPGNYTNMGLNQVAVAKGLIYVTTYAYPRNTTMTVINAADGSAAWSATFPESDSINPPTVYKGNVYVQRSNNANDTDLRSFNAQTGALNWIAPLQSQFEKYLAPTIYQSVGIWVDGGTSGGLYGINFDGSQHAFINEPQYDAWTPTYYNGMIYSWVDGTFNAVNPATGAVAWSVTEPDAPVIFDMNCAAPIDNNIAILNGTTSLTAVNIVSHATLWTVSGNFSGSPSVKNGIIYIISGTQVQAISVATGALVSNMETLDQNLAGQPVVANDAVVVSSTSATYLFNLQTNALVQTIPFGGPVSVAGGTLYIASPDSNVRAFAASTPMPTFAAGEGAAITTFGYNANGQTFTPTLDFVPTPGTVLTLVNNTSSSPITGTFSNLPNGGLVSLVYNSTTYLFTTNYSGGDGNDVTLTYTSAAPQAPVITSPAPLPTVAVNTPYNFALAASGFPAPTFAVTSGALPPGISISASGTLSGTSTQVGTYTGSITATNASGRDQQTFSIAVQSNLSLTVNLPGTVNEADPDGTGTITANATSASNVTIQLVSSNTGALTVPATIVLPAGQLSVTFPYTIIDNVAVSGAQTAFITAQVPGWIQGGQLVSVTDDKTTDNWSTFGNGVARTGVYPGPLLGGTYSQAWTVNSNAGAPVSQVAVAKGLVFMADNNSGVTALNAFTGAQVWNEPLGGHSRLDMPTVYKGRLYISRVDNYQQSSLITMDTASGNLGWSVNFNSQGFLYFAPLVYQPVGIWNGAGYEGGLNHYGFDSTVLSFTAQSFDDEWTASYYNGTVYTWVGDDGQDHLGTLSAINPATGAVLWSTTAPAYFSFFDMNCAVPISNNIAYLQGLQYLTAVNLTTHTTVWSVQGTFTGTPAISNGKVYVISGAQVEVLNATTGAAITSYTTTDTTLAGQPVVASDSLVVSSPASTFLFNLSTGALVQTIPFGGPVSAAGGMLFLAGSDGILRTYQSQTASLNFTSGGGALTTYGYSATGVTLAATLGFAPAPGAQITVINNTGTDPISGTFSNLPDGGTINLIYNGTMFTFLANYEGGDGNDLTLTYTPPGGGIPAITSASQPAAASIATPYTYTYSSTGFPAPTFTVTSGSLPPGLTLLPSGVITGIATKGGVYSGTISASNGIGAAAVQNFSIAVNATFTQWEGLYMTSSAVSSSTTGGASATPMHDGVPNLLKYLFDINPATHMSVPDQAGLPLGGVDTTTTPGMSYLTLTYRENQLASGVIVSYETTSDLKTWQVVKPDITRNLGTDATTGDPMVQVEVKATSGTQFLRLNVTTP